MNKESFINTVNAYQSFLNITDKLIDLGIDLAEGPITNSIDVIFDAWLEAITDDEGIDLIYWWLFEDVKKIITDEDGTEHNVESLEDFATYLDRNGYF